MSREVFEYFFEPEELEPFYSELRKLPRERRSLPAEQAVRQPTNPVTSPEATADAVQGRTEESGGSEVCEQESRLEVSADDPSTVAVTGENPNSTPPSTASPESGTTPAAQTRTRVRQLLSVHALGQYVYCARSAILAAERGDEQDVDEPPPRLSYLPNFDRERIEELLSRKLGQLGFAALYGVSMLCLMVAGVLSQNRTLFYPALFIFVACVMWFISLSTTIVQLAARRRAAIRAEAREADPRVTGIQPVNWWSMLKAGFEPVDYDRPFRHPELPLEGCPWRVLERHSQRIPVIRSGGDKLGGGPGQLYPKHAIRLAAYALLLEAMGHVDVPYGLVFPQDSPCGLALPITNQLRERTVKSLEEFAHILQESQQRKMEPRPPEEPKRCANCPHGFPLSLRPDELKVARKSESQTVVLQAVNGKTYHCVCGDRFGTAPPHGQSIKLGLTASLE